MIKLILVFFLFSLNTYATLYEVSSRFMYSTNQNFVEIKGLSFSVKTAQAEYLVAPFHVLGGKNPSVAAGSELVYTDVQKDIIIFKVSPGSYISLFTLSDSCSCLVINKSAGYFPEKNKFYLANQIYTAVPAALIDSKLAERSEYNKKNVFQNFANINAIGYLEYNTPTKSGFSGSPVIGFQNRLMGIIVKYDSSTDKTYAFKESKLVEILQKIETSPVIIQASPIQYKFDGQKLFKDYSRGVMQKSGGDISDGGNLDVPQAQPKPDSSGLAVDGKNIAYFQVGSKRIYPNNTSLDLIESLNINIKNVAVIETPDTERIFYPFYNLNKIDLTTTSFEYPLNARKEHQILSKIDAKIENNLLHMQFSIYQPKICEVNLTFKKDGSLLDNESFTPVLQIERCELKIELDLRSFFFINLNSSKDDSQLFDKMTPVILSIKINNVLIPVRFY